MPTFSNALGNILRPVLAAFMGLALGVGLTWFAGEDPLAVLLVIYNGAFGTAYDLGMTLFYATPLIFTGLAVAIPFHAGLFNIGAEGQLTMGALAAMGVGICLPTLPPGFAIPLAAAAAIIGGAAWGAIAGWLRAYRGSHEVISTIMLNFVAAGLSSWVVLHLVPSTDSQNPESMRLGIQYLLAHYPIFSEAPVSFALILALIVAGIVWLLLARSVIGFEIKTVGANSEAAATAGIIVPRIRLLALTLAGGIAGLVGVAEVLGNAGRFRLGFSPDYGFIGIPVALLARCHPIGVVLGALLFGALQKGTSDLDLETNFVTRDLSSIIQALVILCISLEGFWAQRVKGWGRKRV